MRCDKEFLSLLPRLVRCEIVHLLAGRMLNISMISEIRIRRFGRSSFKLGCEDIEITSEVGDREMEELLSSLIGEERYLHRESLESGFLSIGGGIRVGVFGEARYDGGRFVGLSEISSVVFRIPTSDFDMKDELYSAYKTAKTGLLIYSNPGGGKTTALRSLASMIGKESNESVAIIDERREFIPSDYSGKRVDILRGYKRSQGIEIALRCAAPTVIIVDEIAGESDVEAIYKAAFSGVRVVASAHSNSVEAIKKRRFLLPLIDLGIFDVLFGIHMTDGRKRFCRWEVV